MSQNEKTGKRDLAYSAWHRPRSISRYIDRKVAITLTMADIDTIIWLEYDIKTKEPLVLIETAVDRGQFKLATCLKKLAIKANIPCFVVLYTLAEHQNPADTRWKDIEKFRVKRLWPKPERRWQKMTPRQWAETLLKIREGSLEQY